jgi:hypothetical protein
MNYGNRREIRIQTPNGERVITPEIVKNMLKTAGIGSGETYSSLENWRRPGEPGLCNKTTGRYIGHLIVS